MLYKRFLMQHTLFLQIHSTELFEFCILRRWPVIVYVDINPLETRVWMIILYSYLCMIYTVLSPIRKCTMVRFKCTIVCFKCTMVLSPVQDLHDQQRGKVSSFSRNSENLNVSGYFIVLNLDQIFSHTIVCYLP